MERPRPVVVPALLALALIVPAARGGSLSVLGHSPEHHAVAAPTGTTIAITFDQALDPTSLDAGTLHVFGAWSGVAPMLTALESGDTVLRIVPTEPFFPGERVTVGISTGVLGAGGDTLPSGGYRFEFWTRPAQGTGSFGFDKKMSTRLRGEGLIRSYGIHAGDLDDDGAPDFSIPNEVASDVRVFSNDGCGTMEGPEVHPVAAFSSPSANVGQDFDGDGVFDLATANWSGDNLSVLLGDGAGSYLPAVTMPAGNGPRGIAAPDVDGDGDRDLVVANRSSTNLGLYVNAGDGTFGTMQAFEGGGHGETSLAATDVDNDGLVDLAVAHFSTSDVTTLLGDGTGSFTVAGTASVGAQPWMITAGDVNGDGIVDAATSDSGSATATVLRGDGSGGLVAPTSLAIGNFSVAVDLGDIDGDGDLDLVTSSFSDARWTCWTNDGSGGFSAPFLLDASVAASCATIVDYDRDGFMDIVGIDEMADEISFFSQDMPIVLFVQPATCKATMRVDNLADRAGFGGTPPLEVPHGGTFNVGITGEPDELCAILVGLPKPFGTLFTMGLLNMQDGYVIVQIVRLDDDGEFTRLYVMPTDLTPIDATLQVIVDDPGGLVLTNPQTLRIVP